MGQAVFSWLLSVLYLHHAAQVAELLGAGLELVELVAVAAVVHQLVGVEARPAEGVEIGLAELPEGEGQQGVDEPSPGGSGDDHVDHRQAGGRAVIAPSSPPRWSPSYCRPVAPDGLLPAAVMPP